MCVFMNYLNWEVEDIMYSSVKFHENRNHGLLNSEIELRKPSSFSERDFGISHTYMPAVNLLFSRKHS